MKRFLLIAFLMLATAALLCGCNTTTAPDMPEYLYTTYHLDGADYITLTKYVGEKNKVEIPAELDGMTVTEIGEDCFSGKDIVSGASSPSEEATDKNNTPTAVPTATETPAMQ